MASHAYGSHSIAALASVSRRVLASSPAPVLLVRPGGVRTTRIRTLLVPVDGSPGGSLALGVALAMTRVTGARIVLLDVVVPLAATEFGDLQGMTHGGFVDPNWEQLAHTTARAYVDGLAEQLARKGVNVEPRLATGEVVAEIERCAAEIDADLVVMSTHSVVWPLQAYLGSVADAVLRDGRRPVLLIRREAPVGDTAAEKLATV
jgi:nucleotide-binding universal stress UspA family protein